MRVEVVKAVRDALLESVWALYREAFDELRTTAVQRHLMYRSEFDDVMADTRVDKYIELDDADRPHGLATFTNRLESMPLISLDYFQHRWPVAFGELRIWYVGFVAVHPTARATGVFERLVEAMCRAAVVGRGMIAMDICRRNEELYGLPNAVHALLDRFSGGARGIRMDEQTYWLYEFPATA
jgi:hypothetical protein